MLAPTRLEGSGTVEAAIAWKVKVPWEVVNMKEPRDVRTGKLGPGPLSSTVTVSEVASQPPRITTHTNLGTITVLGLPIGLTESGLSVVGANIPLAPEVINQTLDHALSAGGLGERGVEVRVEAVE